MKHYLQKHALKAVEIHNLRLAFEEVTGKDLNWFFNQWFLSTGHPSFEITHEYNSKNKLLILNVTQKQDTIYTPIFKIPTDITVWIEGDKIVFPIEITQREESFTFTLSEEPNAIQFANEYQVLGQFKHKKSNDEILAQLKNAKSYLNLSKSIKQMKQLDSNFTKKNSSKIGLLLADKLKDKHSDIRLKTLQLSDNLVGLNYDFSKQWLKMASKDKQASVRAKALSTIISQENINEEQKSVIQKALQDSSYTVEAIALEFFLKSKDSIEYFNKYKDNPNTKISMKIADYIIKHNITDMENWFIYRMKHFDFVTTYHFTKLFAEYINNLANDLSEEKINESLNEIEKIAINSELPFINKMVYSSLIAMKNCKGINARLDTIEAKETNLSLIDFYKKERTKNNKNKE